MVAEIWASVISSFVDQLVALKNIHNTPIHVSYPKNVDLMYVT